MNVDHRTILSIAQVAAITTCELMGVDTAISYSEGARTYGSFFRDMVKARRLQPCRSGKGKNGKRFYAVKDIIALQAEEQARAELL